MVAACRWYHQSSSPCLIGSCFVLFVYREARQARMDLLNAISDPARDIESIEKNQEKYFGLLHGFITSLDPSQGGSDSSKVRHGVRFKWTNTLKGQAPQ